MQQIHAEFGELAHQGSESFLRKISLLVITNLHTGFPLSLDPLFQNENLPRSFLTYCQYVKWKGKEWNCEWIINFQFYILIPETWAKSTIR